MNPRRYLKFMNLGLTGLLMGCLLIVSVGVPSVSVSAASPAAAIRNLPNNAVLPGETFTVEITFVAPDDDCKSLGIHDESPTSSSDWLTDGDTGWCNPNAFTVKYGDETDNLIEYTWQGPYEQGTTVKTVYHVTVPDNVLPGKYHFPVSDNTTAWFGYYIGTNPYKVAITGECQVTVEKPAEVWVDDDWASNSTGDYVDGHVFGYDAFSTIQDGIDGVGNSTVNVLEGTYGAFNITSWDGLTISAESGAVVNATAPFSDSGWDIDVMGLISNSTNIRIDGLEFDGSSLSNSKDEYGIFSLNSTADFTDLSVHDLDSDSGSRGVGIGVVGGLTTADISECTIADCEIGIKVKNDTANISDCTITGMNGCSTKSIGIQAQSGAVVNADGCDISKCVTTSPPPAPVPGQASWWGKGVEARSGATVVLDCCNKIHHNDVGIWVESGACGEEPQVSGGYLTANDNSIYDNTNYGLYYEGGVVEGLEAPGFILASSVDAEENWWGHASGPGGAGDGSGDNVTAGVDFIPWLDAPCDEHPETVGPNAEFWGTPTTGLEPLCVDFTDESEPYDEWDIVEWAWDFGDGTTSTEKNPTHCYPAAGTYTVSLEITDEEGLSDTETKEGYIVVRAPEGLLAPPEPANFAVSYMKVSPQQVLPGQEVEISINIANHGGESGAHNVALFINGYVEQSQTVSVSPGATRLVVFRTSKTVPGTYQVSMEGAEGQFIVLDVSESTAQPAATAGGGGLGTAGIIVIVVVVITLVVALVFGVIRRE
ncbi:MAG: PKD domain-containing protein [Dehalococcoidia bacterium]|nr:PKD domain-containing protein [Dehalococcoidia bacterium]